MADVFAENGKTLRVAVGESVVVKLQGVGDVVPDKAVFIPQYMSSDPFELELEDGELTFPAQAACDLFNVVWQKASESDVFSSVAESRIEIVGAHYFPIEMLRYCGDGTDDFSDLPDAALWAARQEATEVFEQNACRSFVERIGCRRVYLPVNYVKLDDCDVREVISPDCFQLVSDCQVLSPKLRGNCLIVYRYGAQSIPSRVAAVVLELAAYYLRPSAVPDRAIGEQTDAGFLRYTIAGRDGATGLPEIDAVIEQYGRKRYQVG